MAISSGLGAISWKIPATIILSYTCSILLALGHHLFYQSLNGQAVDDTLLNQQFNNDIGTAFAFLVRHALAIAVGASFWQVFWGALSRKSLSIGVIDSLAGLLTAIQGFANISALKAEPLLALIALLAWLLPIPAVIPPGTLSVQAVPTSSVHAASVPAIDFAGREVPNVVEVYTPKGEPGVPGPYPRYMGPSAVLLRLAMATAFQGNIPSLDAPASTSFYSLDFHAPALNCEQASVDLLEGFNGVMGCSLMHDEYVAPCSSYQYLSWVPGFPDAPDVTSPAYYVPFTNGSMNSSSPNLPLVDVYGNSGSFLESNGDQMQLFVAIRQYTANSSLSQWAVTNCTLHNATYTVDFNFHDGIQDVRVLSRQLTGKLSPEGVIYRDNLTSSENEVFSYQALMETLGKLLVGSIYNGSVTDSSVLIQDATSIMQTNVAYAQEVFNLYNVTTSYKYPGCPACAQPFGSVIERLFENMTLALFSDQLFQTTETMLPTTFHTTEMQNIYSYDWQRLLLAYCINIGITFFIILLGCLSLVRNQASYSNKFSTIMRTTREADIDTALAPADMTGSDPLPKHIKRAKIRIGPAMHFSSGSDLKVEQPAKVDSTVHERTAMISDHDSVLDHQ